MTLSEAWYWSVQYLLIFLCPQLYADSEIGRLVREFREAVPE